MAFSAGQPTYAQKKMMNLMATKTQQPTTSALLPAIYDQSSSPLPPSPRVSEWQQSVPAFYGDVEMEDASAVNSAAGSPPTATYSHLRPQSSFSAVAKPFTPPVVPVAAETIRRNLATSSSPPHRPLGASSPQPEMARPMAPARKMPPHRAMKEQSSAPALAPPVNKLVVPVASAIDEPTAQSSPKRARGLHSGPHSKMTPQAQKMSGSLSNMSFESVSLPQTDSQPRTTDTSREITPVGQNAWIDVQQPNTEPESWTDVQRCPTETVKAAFIFANAEPAQRVSKPEAVVDDLPSLKAAAEVPPMLKTVAEISAPSKAAVGALPISKAVPPPHMKRLQAARDAAAGIPCEQISESPSHYERTQWLAMLLDGKDTAKGRELIRAFSDHIRAGVIAGNMEAATPDSDQEIWMEFSAGQRLSAQVSNDTKIKHVINDFAKLTHSEDSECALASVRHWGRFITHLVLSTARSEKHSASRREQQSRSPAAAEDKLFVPHSPAADMTTTSINNAASAMFDGVETILYDLEQRINELKQYARELDRDKRHLRAILVANHDSKWVEQQIKDAEARDVSPQWESDWHLGTNRRSAPQMSRPLSVTSQGKKRTSDSDASTPAPPTKTRRLTEPSIPSGLGSSILEAKSSCQPSSSSSTTSPISPSSTRKQQITLPPIIHSSPSRLPPQLDTGAPAFHPNVQPSANRQGMFSNAAVGPGSFIREGTSRAIPIFPAPPEAKARPKIRPPRTRGQSSRRG
ncbi:hypothetical protein E4T39_07726 [Aureobasidium subglaciale]|nr:hypothetical protein E4T39_07726 [Aureobasidium subglaciale]